MTGDAAERPAPHAAEDSAMGQPLAGVHVAASTRVFAVLGDPVGHSLSPALHNAALQAGGLDGVYVALGCPEGALGGLMRGLAQAGGGGNVTVPHKEAAAELVDVASDSVRRTGACNTFWASGGRLHGDNTDVEGFRRALEVLLEGGAPQGLDVLVLGAGGAARAVLAALLDGGARSVYLRNRSEGRAARLIEEMNDVRIRYLNTHQILGSLQFDLVVNATSVGMEDPRARPLDLAQVGGVGALMDLVYGRESPRLVRDAMAAGVPALDGRLMLLHQGAAAFERWWPGVEPDLVAMERALVADRAPGLTQPPPAPPGHREL